MRAVREHAWLVLAIACSIVVPVRAGGADRAPLFDAPLAFAPLDTPLVVTGGFSEYRIGHFHAGFDFGTNQRVGATVRAPLPGFIARVRASGVGYGRSIYLRTTDGRLLQFGHLDAFSGPLAAWVDSIQRATGQYEQDLYPEPGRFRVKAGERIAWTGESGAGGPHLHFEIRRGDMAYHPERAGLRVRDPRAPTLESVTLEPLDDVSFVEGSAAPRTIRLTARPDTVRAIGRLRAIVAARDGAWSGVDRMVPWSTRIDWDGGWVECRLDSISWATDMAEGDYVYDAGRVLGDKGFVLWAPTGWRPRFIVSSAPLGQEAGTLVVATGDAPRTLRLSARDAAGNAVERSIVLVPGPAGTRAGTPPPGMPAAALPGGFVRHGSGASAVVTRAGVPPAAPTLAEWGITWDPPVAFDSVALAWSRPARRAGPAELIPVRALASIGPDVPLRQPLALHIATAGIADTARVGLYRYARGDWDWVRLARRPDGIVWDAETRVLGEFHLFADTLAPRLTFRKPARKVGRGAYPRWAVEVGVEEDGSGVDARASWFTVDGRRVPVEWDSEARVLRWRPLRAPARGTHRLSAVATDRSGNQRIRSTTFVLD